MSARHDDKRGSAAWMVWIAITVFAGTARGQPDDPAKITGLAEFRQALQTQVATVRGEWQRGKRHRQELAAARDAWKQQRQSVEPGRKQLAELNRRIGMIDGNLAWQRLPAELKKLIDFFDQRRSALQKDLDLHVAVTVGRPADRRQKQLEKAIAALEQATDTYRRYRRQVQQALPRLPRPPFVPAGETLPAHRTKLVTQRAQLTARLKPGEDRLTRLGQALRGAIDTASRHDDLVAAAERRYYELLYQLHTRFLPAHITEVKLTAPFDPRAKERVYYHARVEDPDALRAIDAKIAMLVEQLPTVRRRIGEARRVWENCERKFTAVTDRWLEKNDTYEWLLYKEYTLNAAAEVADVFIGLASDGFAPPAVLFELAWRTGEAFTNDFRVTEPKLDDALLNYRQRLARELTPTPDNPVPANADDAQVLRAAERRLRDSRRYETLAVTAEDIIDNQVGEFWKGAGGNAFGLLAERLAEEALKRGRRVQGDRLLRAMTIAALHPDVNFDTFRQFTGTSKAKFFKDVDRVIAGGVADRADTLVKKLKDPGTYGDMVKGFAMAATVTVVKDAIKNGIGYTDQRARLMADMAILDIEWFARRAEYQAAAQFHRQCIQMLMGYKAKIGELYEKRAKIAERTPKLRINRPFATWDHVHGILRFSQPVRDVAVRIGTASASTSVARDGLSATFRVGAPPFATGEVPIEIRAQRKDVDGVALDAVAQSVARYSGPTLRNPNAGGALWTGLDAGPDATHRIRAEAPSLEVADADAARGYIPGDYVALRFKLPGSLPYQRLRLMAVPMQEPVEINIPAAAEGTIQFRLPDKAANYRLVIVGGPRGDFQRYVQVAETNVVANLTILQTLPNGPFTKATRAPLPSRGPWIRPSKRAIPEGKGRILIERRNAGQAPWALHTAVRPTGSKKAVDAGWQAEIDVAPGSYDITLGATIPIEFRGVVVTAGQTTRTRTPAVGRLRLRTDDALGKPANPHRRVYRGAEKKAVYAGYAKSLELPPGDYRVVFDYVVPIEHTSITVTAGHESHLHASGYGRFDFQRRDALGKAANKHVRITRKSDGKGVYAGYSPAVDLPPGAYKVVFDYTVPMVFDNLTLPAGRAVPLRSQPLGRVTIRSVDASGAEKNAHRSIHRGDEAVYAGYAKQLDLPPGAYVLKFRSGDEDRRIGFSVQAGTTTPVRFAVR